MMNLGAGIPAGFPGRRGAGKLHQVSGTIKAGELAEVSQSEFRLRPEDRLPRHDA
jgi:hypothetical protein